MISLLCFKNETITFMFIVLAYIVNNLRNTREKYEQIKDKQIS